MHDRKVILKVSVSPEMKAHLDTLAAEQEMDRSAWILKTLEETLTLQDVWEHLRLRLDHQDRQVAGLQEAVVTLTDSLQQLVEALKVPATPAKKVYPTPARLEDVYPELKAMREPVDQTALLAARLAEHRAANPPAPVKKGLLKWILTS